MKRSFHKSYQQHGGQTVTKWRRQPTDILFLLLESNGTAAINILVYNMTMHSALRLPLTQHTKYSVCMPLSQENLHNLRRNLNSLTLVIFVEISMVSSDDLYNINSRFTEINWTPDSDVYFGGNSLLFVGDLFQIPPVAGKPVHSLLISSIARLAGSNSSWGKRWYWIHKLTQQNTSTNLHRKWSQCTTKHNCHKSKPSLSTWCTAHFPFNIKQQTLITHI